MLTQVILDGAMGAKFGREWNLQISSPAEALRIIDANEPGLFGWVKQNLKDFDRYQVVCEFADGRVEELDNDTVFMECKPTKIRFIPIIAGAGSATGRFVAGLIIFIIGAIMSFYSCGGASGVMMIGISMMVGAAVEMLSPKPKTDANDGESKNKTSHYFDGPTNTTMQGVPVPLIYGRVRVGSHHISAAISVDQLI